MTKWTTCRRFFTGPTALIALLVAGCGRAGSPFAALDGEVGRIDLPWPQHRTIALRFTPLDEPSERLGRIAIFAHLYNADRELVRTFDHPLPAGWKRGQPLDDRFELYQSALGDPLPAGDYDLVVGVYELEGEKLPLRASVPEVKKRQYRAATVVVPPRPSSTEPVYRLFGSWSDPEFSADRQYPGARDAYEGEPAGIELLAPRPAGELLLVLALHLKEGEGRAAIRDECTGSQQAIAGRGAHSSLIRLPAAAEDQTCKIYFDADPGRRPRGKPPRRTVRLGGLAFRPTPAAS